MTEKQKKYRKYLNSDKWKDKRKEILLLRGYKCEKCDSKKKLHVHHLTYDNIFNEKNEDLQLLCAECHLLEHKHIKKRVKNKIKSKTKKKGQISFQKKCKMLESKAGRRRLRKLKYEF